GFELTSDLSSSARLNSRWRLSLHGFRIGIRGLIAQALQHGQARIFREPGVCSGELAHIERGPAVGVDFTHVHAMGTQAYLRELALRPVTVARTCCSGTRMAWKSALPAFSARPTALPIAFTSKRPIIQRRIGSVAPSVTPRFTISTTTAAFSVDIVSRRVPRMRLRTGTALNWRPLTLPILSCARSKCWPLGQHTWEPTSYSIRPT